jgi:hypothetical protein
VVFFDGIAQGERHSPDDCFGDQMVLRASRSLIAASRVAPIVEARA